MFDECFPEFSPISSLSIRIRRFSIIRILFLFCILAFFIFILFFRYPAPDDFWVFSALALMSGFGFFCLFSWSTGFLNFTVPSSGDKLSRSFLASMPQGLVITDSKGYVIYANPSYRQMTAAVDFSDVKSLEEHFSSFPEASAVLLKMRKRLKEGESAQGEFRLTGSLFYPEYNMASWYRVRACNLNITHQKESFHAWQLYEVSSERIEQERFFLNLQKAIDYLDQAPAGFFATEEDGKISCLNATLADWLEIDFTGFVPGNLFLADLIAKEGLSLVESLKADPDGPRDVILDLDLLTVSGKMLPVRFIHRLIPGKEEQATLCRTIVLNRTPDEREGRRLEDLEVRFARFFNSVPIAIACLDRKGHFLQGNAAFFSLFPSVFEDGFFHGCALTELIDTADHAEFFSALEKAAQGYANIAPVDTIFPGNKERHIRFYLNLICGAGPLKTGTDHELLMTYITDVTEQKVLETQVAQNQKMQAIGQLAGGIAHDFNNVLTAIMMSSDILLTTHRPSDPSFPEVMNIKQNADRAASLVRQLLAFSRKQTFQPKVFNLIDVFADLRMLLTRLVGPEITLAVDHGRDLWSLKTDIGQFEQVVVNIALNARDAMPEGGKVIIRTRNVLAEKVRSFSYRELVPADYVLVEFEDSGIGIPASLKEKIFEPFFTTKEVGKGTGLGLSMVYGIIKQMGGLIFCDSTPNEGSVFRIFLPRFLPPRDEEPAVKDYPGTLEYVSRKAITATDLSGSATVLLVEDEDSVRIGGVRALESRGYKVYEASSGLRALEIFKSLQHEVDLIVSDVVMPEMDGPTLLGEVRKLRPDVLFVFVSGYAEDAFERNLPPEEKFVFLPKPFSLKQLAIVVKETLGKKA